MNNHMRKENIYFDSMKSKDQITRLDIKTDSEAIKERAQLCGIGPGARVLDAGCFSGKVSSILNELVQPEGEVVGIDHSEERIRYAIDNFGNKGIDFQVMDFNGPLGELGQFDFVWMQFVLEFFREESPDIVKRFTSCLKPDGYLCLLDLDYNCLNYYQLPDDMEVMLHKVIKKLEMEHNFDPYAGIKLFSYLYDLNYRDIQVNLVPHHLIYGDLKSTDDLNWARKVELASQLVIDIFDEYTGGYDSFFSDFEKFFNDPRRFCYSPLIICKGKKPLNNHP
jgi:SAM-dependent methyltransferase